MRSCKNRRGLEVSLVLLAAACTSGDLPLPDHPPLLAPVQCVAGSLPDSLAPSREGFFREVLFAGPTPRTPRFDDYTEGSYHAAKVDLARGLAAEAARCGLDLQLLLVLGPVGPLWAYHVMPFIADGDSVRVNTLVMPHARITGKATGRRGRAQVEQLLAKLTASPLLMRGLPAGADTATDLGSEFGWELLLTRYEAGEARHWHAELREADAAAVESVFAAINAFLDGLQATYPAPDSSKGA